MEVLVSESRSNHNFYAVEDPGILLKTWYHYGATFLMDTQLKLYTNGILVIIFYDLNRDINSLIINQNKLFTVSHHLKTRNLV